MAFNYGSHQQRLEDTLRSDPSNAQIAFELATIYCKSGQLDKCLKAMAYVVSIEPSYSTLCAQYLHSYGYPISEEELKEEAINEVLEMTDAAVASFYYDRLRLPDLHDINRILKREPFNSFKNPYTGNSIYLSDPKGGEVMIEISEAGIEITGFKRTDGKKMPLKTLRYKYRR
mgnify:CR=1 FL=1